MSDRGRFGPDEAGSLVENNILVFIGTPVLEQAFEYSLRATFEFGQDWHHMALRTVCIFAAYNILKWWTLLQRDADGMTRLRRGAAWIWVKLFGE